MRPEAIDHAVERGRQIRLEIFDVVVVHGCAGFSRHEGGEFRVVRQQVLHRFANEIDAVVQVLDRRVDFMRHARGEAADGFEMFALRETLFGEFAFGDVEADADDADHHCRFRRAAAPSRYRPCAACR